MNSLSESQLKTLIDLEARGEITPQDIYRRAALAKVQRGDPYVNRTLGYVGLGGLLMFFAGQAVFPFVAAMWALDIVKTYQRRRTAIRDISGGNIIDYLEGDDVKAYERDVLEKPAIDVTASTIETTPEVHSPAIGNNTRLTAVDVQALPTGQTVNRVNAMAPIAKPSLQIVDLPTAMGRSLHPTIISAKPRVGKGMVIQSAWRAAKKAHPGITVYVIDPKPHPSESAYWEGVDRYWGRMVEDFPVNDEALATELTELIHEWRAQGNRPTLLIIDELVKLEAVLPKWYKDFLISTMKVEASSGETDKRFLWAIAQSPQVKDLGLTGGSRAVFDFLTLQRADSVDHAERVKASINAIKTIPSADEFASIPSGVAFWHSRCNQWGGVPVLEVPKAQVVKVAAGSDLAEFERDFLQAVETRVKPVNPDIDEATAAELEDDDPIIDKIGDIPDRDKRDALMIGYQWATKRQSEGKPVDKASFLARARNERNCLYLKDNRDEVWEELSTLIF